MSGGQAFGKGEGLEGGGRRVAWAVFQARAEPQGPRSVKPAVQNAEGGVVVAGNNDQLMVGTYAGVAPNEQSVLCDRWRGDVALQAVERLPHRRTRTPVLPPKVLDALDLAVASHRPYVCPDVCKRCLVQRCLRFGHRVAKVYYPVARKTSCEIHAVNPRFEHVGIGPAIRV